MATGVLAYHAALLESWFTAPIQLGRGSISLQGATTWLNIRSVLKRYLGYCATVRGLEETVSGGLFALLDGDLLMGFIAYMLQERGLALASVAQAVYTLEKVRAPVRHTVLRPPFC